MVNERVRACAPRQARPPPPPTFSAVTQSSATVNWPAPTGGTATYKLDRAPDSGGSPGTWTIDYATGIAGTSYPDSSVTCGATYWYRVSGANATGDGSYSGSAKVTIP